jgi:hypothetical protein
MAPIDREGGCCVRVRLTFALTLSIALVLMLAGAAASQAAPGNLRILIVRNIADPDLANALTGYPGVAAVDTFDSSAGTPSAATLATYDLVASTGDGGPGYQDQALWGNRLADFLDAGGALIQFAYDNWDNTVAHPTGRFESGGYAPFIPGPDDALPTSLGTILVPGSPLLVGVPSFDTEGNVTPALAPGATLLAKWADNRLAIATKGRVLSVGASPTTMQGFNPMSAAAQLAVNAGNVLHAQPPSTTTGQRAAALKKCKKKHKKHHNKKKFKKCKKKAKLLPV